MNLTDKEKIRYSRHLQLKEIGEEGQLKLKSARVLVIGAGGLGCPALLYLTAAGIGTIGIADFDSVEESNLQRQVLYTINDIGLNKAKQASVELKKLNPLLQFDVFSTRLAAENILDVLRNYDIVIDGTDNFESRYMINDACVLLNKIHIYGSVYKMHGQISVFNYPMNNGSRSATYRDLFPLPSSDDEVSNCSVTGILGVLPGMVGTLQATEVIKIITGIGIPLFNTMLTVDAYDMQFSKWNFSRNENNWINFPSSAQAFEIMNYNLFCNGAKSSTTVSLQEFNDWIAAGIPMQIIDVREANERTISPFHNVIHIPFSEFDKMKQELDFTVKTIVFCSSGTRSALIVNMLLENMSADLLYSLQGGIHSLQEQVEN